MSEVIKILQIEDSAHDAEITKCTLKKHFPSCEFSWAKNKEEFYIKASIDKYNVIICDYDMNGFTALDVLDDLKKCCEITPVIILSGVINDVRASSIIERGASDYVLKDNMQRLPFSIRSALMHTKEKEFFQMLKNQYEAIISSSNAGLVQIDRDGKCLFMNNIAKVIIGLSGDSCYDNQFISDIVPDIDLACLDNDTSQKQIAIEKNNEESYISIHISVNRDISGACQGYNVTLYDVTEQVRSSYKANYDPLTSLPNRYFFNDYFESLFNRAARENICYTVLAFDVDDFKSINDTLGHDAGDAVLKEIATRVKGVLRKTDICSRLGGDEFIIICLNAQSNIGFTKSIDKIRLALGEPFFIKGVELNATTSMGACVVSERNKYTQAQILKNADIALYKSKESGKNRVTIYENKEDKELTNYYKLKDDLENLSITNSINVLYQPIYFPDGKKIHGLEALARWNDVEDNAVDAKELIKIAEKFGLITSLGHALREKALAQLCDWKSILKYPISIHLNISLKEVDSDNKMKDLNQQVKRHNLSSSDIVFELRESQELCSDKGQAALQRISSYGYGVSIDNFTGEYLSIQNLLSYNLRMIKLSIKASELNSNLDAYDKLISIILCIKRLVSIDLVLVGIESNGHKQDAVDLNDFFLQGNYYCAPDIPESIIKILTGN